MVACAHFTDALPFQTSSSNNTVPTVSITTSAAGTVSVASKPVATNNVQKPALPPATAVTSQPTKTTAARKFLPH